jgi:hypothetical protein
MISIYGDLLFCTKTFCSNLRARVTARLAYRFLMRGSHLVRYVLRLVTSDRPPSTLQEQAGGVLSLCLN